MPQNQGGLQKFNLAMESGPTTTTRRPRNDPESRDFSCKCGKKYLSYAAVYTHVKQKHHLDKSYLQSIGKPVREKQPRGRRPREHKEASVSSDIEEISVLEEAILHMHTLINKNFEKMILEGNETLDADLLDTEYKNLLTHFGLKKLEESDHQVSKFIHDFNRHFTAEVAARVKLVVLFLLNDKDKDESQKFHELDQMDVWGSKNEANALIYQTYDKWTKVQH